MCAMEQRIVALEEAGCRWKRIATALSFGFVAVCVFVALGAAPQPVPPTIRTAELEITNRDGKTVGRIFGDGDGCRLSFECSPGRTYLDALPHGKLGGALVISGADDTKRKVAKVALDADETGAEVRMAGPDGKGRVDFHTFLGGGLTAKDEEGHVTWSSDAPKK